MSMSTSIVYGFGFYTDKVSDKSLLSFVRDNVELLREAKDSELSLLEKEMDSNPSFRLDVPIEELPDILCDAFKIYPDFTFCYILRDALLQCAADIMREQTGIPFEYHAGQKGYEGEEGAILLAADMPWNFSGITVDEETFIKRCKKYTAELGIPDEDIMDIRIEYYG